MTNSILAPVSVGELLDKITILEIKRERIKNKSKLSNVVKELGVLQSAADNLGYGQDFALLISRLKSINYQLWDAEDRIRDCERRGMFETEFVALARSIYRLNDQRAQAKREINLQFGSQIVEEKSYQDY